jgi:hypothetical protein
MKSPEFFQLERIAHDLVKHGIITKLAIGRDGIAFAVEFTLNGRYRTEIERGHLPAALLPPLQRKGLMPIEDQPCGTRAQLAPKSCRLRKPMAKR